MEPRPRPDDDGRPGADHLDVDHERPEVVRDGRVRLLPLARQAIAQRQDRRRGLRDRSVRPRRPARSGSRRRRPARRGPARRARRRTGRPAASPRARPPRGPRGPRQVGSNSVRTMSASSRLGDHRRRHRRPERDPRPALPIGDERGSPETSSAASQAAIRSRPVRRLGRRPPRGERRRRQPLARRRPSISARRRLGGSLIRASTSASLRPHGRARASRSPRVLRTRWPAGPPRSRRRPFVNPNAGPTESRFVPLSPRVAVLIVGDLVAGLVLWMARDSIRPFILGLLFVYLLDPPVRWLVRRGVRRTFAILIVYVVGIVLFIEVPGADADAAGQRGHPVRRRLPEARREPRPAAPAARRVLRQAPDPDRHPRVDRQPRSPGSARAEAAVAVAAPTCRSCMPLITGAGSLLGAVFAYFILPVWVAYILKDKTTPGRDVRPRRCRRPGGSTRGRSSRPSSATSGSGCAARSCSASRSASRRSSG